jgi:hypothetical protein
MPCIFAVAIISKQNMKYSLKISKERSVHFQISNPPFKSAVPLSEKPIFVHNICGIIDIEHRFQKCNMFETVSIIKQCSVATYNRILSCMATQSSREEAAFLENWNSFV